MTSIPPTPSPDLHHLPTPLIVSIDLTALVGNFQQIRHWIAPSTKILAIIKADAYGHGAVPVARALESVEVFGYGVASVQEGVTLRANHIHRPILVMGPLLPEHMEEIVQYRLTPVISHLQNLQHLIDHLPPDSRPFPVHLKIDTGLHRLGFEANEALAALSHLSPSTCPLEIQGFLTHFADADNPDPTLTNKQIQQFRAFLAQARNMGFHPPILHMANSAGILYHPASQFDMVRPGLLLYGYVPHQRSSPMTTQFRPVMQASTYVAHLRSLQPGEIVGYNAHFRTRRPSHIAVLPVGYTHGFPRPLTGIGHFLIHGQKAPIIGKICMDMMMVDVTDIPNIKIGEQVVLLGKQGSSEITAEDYAGWLNTIPYEILCGIGGKANRRFTTQEDVHDPVTMSTPSGSGGDTSHSTTAPK